MEDARLVVSELATNALVHGQGAIALTILRLDDRVRLEVIDEGSGAPAIREISEDRPGGWGLRIVETLSLRWGAHEGTTHVWAELALPQD